MNKIAAPMTCAFTALLTCASCGRAPVAAAAPTVRITDVTTDRARYAPGRPVTVVVDLAGTDAAAGTVALSCTHLGAALPSPAPRPFHLIPGRPLALTYSWTPPVTDFQGYRVEAQARDRAGRLLDGGATAVDVSSTWTRFPRYGYYGNYPADGPAAWAHTASRLKDYHINVIQFYDCDFKHHIPLAGTVSAPAAAWPNLENVRVERRTLLGMIADDHRDGMAAMQYNLIYGAWAGYTRDGVDSRWGIFKDPSAQQQDGVSFPAAWHWGTTNISLFNPGDPAWQDYILGRESAMMAAYPFDGWHADQLGDHGDEYSFSGQKFEPWRTFAPFLRAAKARLHRAIVFNSCGAYGLYDTAQNSGEDAVYVECWEYAGEKTYNDLKTVVDQASDWSGGKGVVIAAYMDKSYADGFPETAPGAFNTPGVLLTDATLFAAGASHIEIGDDLHVLDSDFFPNHTLLPSAALLSRMRDYYDFQVANESLLQGRMSNSANALHLSVASSPDGEPDTVWAYAKTGGGGHLLNLINLRGVTDTRWRDDAATQPAPTPQADVDVRYSCGDAVITAAIWATPDRDHGAAHALPFTTGTDAQGRYVQFTLPRLDYWDMVYLKTT